MTPFFLDQFEFFTGVPDSQLQGVCDYLMDRYGHDRRHHVIAANEGNAAALAAGYHLATGKIPVVYLQNSGLGHILNPIASLLNDRVYGIPTLFIVGWRGEPGVHDEPQHVFQGTITLQLLEDADITAFVIGQDTPEDAVNEALEKFRSLFANGKSAAFVARKGSLTHGKRPTYGNDHTLLREEAIGLIVEASGTDPIISTTGKTSRELYELRDRNGQGHQFDFLTVGSMGHSSSIALGVALQKPDTVVWCLDGDGAVLMHMGAMATIGAAGPRNLIHVVINNEAHESVGGLPTVAGDINLPSIAQACGYAEVFSVNSADALKNVLARVRMLQGPIFLEIKCAPGSRPDLGRPRTAPQDNKKTFMANLRKA